MHTIEAINYYYYYYYHHYYYCLVRVPILCALIFINCKIFNCINMLILSTSIL